MNPNTSRFSAMHARWRTRAVICCALACSAFWAGNVEAGEYSSDLNSIILRLQDIVEDVEDMRADYAKDYPELYLQIESIAQQANALLSSLDNAKDSTTGGFNVVLAASQLGALTSSLRTLDRDMRALGVGTVTNFLGTSSGTVFHSDIQNDVVGAIRVALGFPPNGFNGYVSSSPFMYPIPDCKTMGEWAEDVFGGHGSYSAPSVPTNMLQYLQYILNAVNRAPADTGAATTNLLETQNTTLERVAEYVAGVSNAVGTISNEYETDPTGSNDLPAEKSPDPLQVEKSVDTSSLEDAVKQTFDGLEGLTPTGSSTVPEIMIRDSYRGEDAIRVRLDLSEISIATRICKACWAILLACGILGIVRSEWDFWTTLGGSAT